MTDHHEVASTEAPEAPQRRRWYQRPVVAVAMGILAVAAIAAPVILLSIDDESVEQAPNAQTEQTVPPATPSSTLAVGSEEPEEPDRPYVAGEDLSLWVTEEEVAEMLEPLSLEFSGGPLSEDVVVYAERDGWEYQYTVGEIVRWDGVFPWGVFVEVGENAGPGDLTPQKVDRLPEEVAIVGQGGFWPCSYRLVIPNSGFFYIVLISPNDVDLGHAHRTEGRCADALLPMATEFLGEMGWVAESDEPGRPYVAGEDLLLWVTEEEAAEMIRGAAARHDVDLTDDDVIVTAEGDGYHYVWGGVNPIHNNYYWGLTLAGGSTLPTEPDDFDDFDFEESELLPGGVVGARKMFFCEWGFETSDGRPLTVWLHTPGHYLLNESECRIEVFRIASAVLHELGWVD